MKLEIELFDDNTWITYYNNKTIHSYARNMKLQIDPKNNDTWLTILFDESRNKTRSICYCIDGDKVITYNNMRAIF